jgi:hypothetical protein
MRSIVSGTARHFGLLVVLALSLSVGSASWAEQREARLLRGPMSPLTERPTTVACTLGQQAACNDAGQGKCGPQCNKGGTASGCQICIDDAKASCVRACGGL